MLRHKFADAIRAGRIQDVEVERHCAVLAAVGQRMAKNKGVAAKFFDALATAGVNIKAMAQGSSEYNITVMVRGVRHHHPSAVVFMHLYACMHSCLAGFRRQCWLRLAVAQSQSTSR